MDLFSRLSIKRGSSWANVKFFNLRSGSVLKIVSLSSPVGHFGCLLIPLLSELSLELLPFFDFFPCCSDLNPPKRRKQGVAKKEQAKEKKKRKLSEANTGPMVSRVDMEEVRTSCCLHQTGCPLISPDLVCCW